VDTTTSTAIRARDFSNSTTDVLRDRWTEGKLRHVIAALNGAPVVVTLDRQTGHTVVGATLVRTGSTYSYDSALIVGTEYGTCGYFLPSVGDTIVPLLEPVVTKGAKWVALDSWRLEQGAAIALAREARPDLDYGKWEATPCKNSVVVRYTWQRGPQNGREVFGLSQSLDAVQARVAAEARA
jgi:hypothetical protein